MGSGISLQPWEEGFSSRNIQFFPANAPLPTIRQNPALAGSILANGAAHIIDTSGTPLANRWTEIGEACGPGNLGNDVAEGYVDALHSSPLIIVSLILAMDGIKQIGPAAGEAFNGFELASLNSNAPLPANPVGSGCIQVRANFIAPNDLILYTCAGNGTADARVRANLALGLLMNEGWKLKLVFKPGSYAQVYGYDDNIGAVRLLAQQTDPTKLPLFAPSYQSRFALIQNTGTAARGQQMSVSQISVEYIGGNGRGVW